MNIKLYLKFIVSTLGYIWRSICFFETIDVRNIDETINILINSNKSLIRFGDGEISLIRGFDIKFQKYSVEIGRDLEVALGNTSDDLIVAIPDIYTFTSLRQYRNNEKIAWMLESIFSYPIYKKTIRKNVCYTSLVSRLYLPFKSDRSIIAERFNKIKKIWDGKRVLFVEGRYTRLGVGNNLFDNVLYVKRILCPEKNAYEKIDLIEKEIRKYTSDNQFDLVILAIGPTAKIIISHLFSRIRMLDLGHIDVEYEWFLRDATEKIAISGKAVNEATNGYDNLYINDKCYETQIISKILD